MGKLDHDKAFKGLKKLIEMTIVELIGWNKGTFTLDTEAIAVSSECRYLPDKMEQAIGLDVQMVLMDALRIFDELERDRKAGKHVPQYEELFGEEVSQIETFRKGDESMVVTADDLGLADIDDLEKKIPQPFGSREGLDKEVFNPVEIHRQSRMHSSLFWRNSHLAKLHGKVPQYLRVGPVPLSFLATISLSNIRL